MFVVLAVVFIALVLSLSCCLCARRIKVVMFMKFGVSFGQRLEMHGKRFDVFVIYDHDADGLFVESELISVFEDHKLKVANQEQTTLGKDIFSGLETMLKLSRTVCIVITNNFIKSNLNLYDLNQAVLSELEQKNFKVVFLMCQKPKEFRKMPDNMKVFLRLGTTVNKFERNWQDSLVYEATHKTRRPLSKRLSFGKTVRRPRLVDSAVLNGIQTDRNENI